MPLLTASSALFTSPNPLASPSDDHHLLISLCKGKHSCTLHPISTYFEGNHPNMLPLPRYKWFKAEPLCMVCQVQPTYVLSRVDSSSGGSYYFLLIYSFRVGYPHILCWWYFVNGMIRLTYIIILLFEILALCSIFYVLSLPIAQASWFLTNRNMSSTCLLKSNFLGATLIIPPTSGIVSLNYRVIILICLYMPIIILGSLGSSSIWLLHIQISLVLWVFFASWCMHPRRSIGMLLFAYLHTWSMLLDVVFFISGMVIFVWRPTLIPIMSGQGD